MKAFKTLSINRKMSESERAVVWISYQRKPFNTGCYIIKAVEAQPAMDTNVQIKADKSRK